MAYTIDNNIALALAHLEAQPEVYNTMVDRKGVAAHVRAFYRVNGVTTVEHLTLLRMDSPEEVGVRTTRAINSMRGTIKHFSV